MSEGLYTAMIGQTRGDDMPVAFKPVVKGVTKREAYGALMLALKGKKAVSGILLHGHTYFAIPSMK